MLRVGVKFCGNCNPHLPVTEIFENIKKLAADSFPQTEFVFSYNSTWDVLLVISSCPIDCANRPAGEYSIISVTSNSVNRVPFAIYEIPAEVTRILSNLCTQ